MVKLFCGGEKILFQNPPGLFGERNSERNCVCPPLFGPPQKVRGFKTLSPAEWCAPKNSPQKNVPKMVVTKEDFSQKMGV